MAGAVAAATKGMPEVALSSGKPMPRVGMGTASFPFDAAERPAAVREAVLRAVEAGYRHFDTAAVYGTEPALGEAAAEAVRTGTLASRDELYITSKLWLTDAHPGRVVPALRRTLRNLQMEYIDLYLIHLPVSLRPPAEGEGQTPAPAFAMEDLTSMDMEGVWEGMEECQRLGLARAIGVSNFSCKKLQTLLCSAEIPPAANQVEVHPHCRQHKLRRFCEEKGVQLCAYSALGGKGTPWGSAAVMDCPVLNQIAMDRGKTTAQIEHRPINHAAMHWCSFQATYSWRIANAGVPEVGVRAGRHHRQELQREPDAGEPRHLRLGAHRRRPPQDQRPPGVEDLPRSLRPRVRPVQDRRRVLGRRDCRRPAKLIRSPYVQLKLMDSCSVDRTSKLNNWQQSSNAKYI